MASLGGRRPGSTIDPDGDQRSDDAEVRPASDERDSSSRSLTKQWWFWAAIGVLGLMMGAQGLSGAKNGQCDAQVRQMARSQSQQHPDVQIEGKWTFQGCAFRLTTQWELVP